MYKYLMHILTVPIKTAKQFERVANTEKGRQMIRIDAFEYSNGEHGGDCTVVFTIPEKRRAETGSILRGLRKSLPGAKIS